LHEELSYQQLKPWFLAQVGRSLSVQITSPRGTVAFVEGSVDGVMGFESTDSSGFSVHGAGGAWTLELAAPEFVSATLSRIPHGALTQLTIKMRDHCLSIDPSDEVGASVVGEESSPP
jgi:hypothetical protein